MQAALASSEYNIHQFTTRFAGKLPDIQSAENDRCQLFPTDEAYVFEDEGTNTFMADLCEMMQYKMREDAKLPDVSVSKFCICVY
jgi:hypothetical protein